VKLKKWDGGVLGEFKLYACTVIIPCFRLGIFLFHSFVSVGADDEPRENVGKIALDVVTVATIDSSLVS
jgi:hypothetical protein